MEGVTDSQVVGRTQWFVTKICKGKVGHVAIPGGDDMPNGMQRRLGDSQ